MPNSNVTIDHVHLISPDPQATANWYVDKLGGEIVRSAQILGTLQIYMSFGDGAMVIVRGQRPAERAADKPGPQWGVDHFGMRIAGDYDSFCAELRRKGIVFTMEPTVMNPTTRIAFIQAPDGVSVELLDRKPQA